MILLLIFAFNLFQLLNCDIVTIDLKNNKWSVTNANKSITVSAKVPGGIYSDLRAGGVLKEDILYRDNDVKYRWVSKVDWTYTTEFEVTDVDFLKKKNQFLVFHGIDTLATIYLNDKELGKTDNMFVRYRFDVKDKLRNKNNLTVVLESPIEGADRIAKTLDHQVPPTCTPASYNGECHINMLRKMQASFAWDWGPAFPSVGIWKKVELESYHSAMIRDVLTDVTYHEDIKSWNIAVHCVVETSLNANETIKAKLTTELTLAKRVLKVDSLVHNYTSQHGEMEISTSLLVPADEVKLWWPNGYGEQPLYNLQVMLFSGIEMSTKNVKIGFRTLELIQSPVDPDNLKKGLHFFFQVNKIPIYSKGSNLIPVSILPEEASNESTIRSLLVSSKEANMNMLRVWGGGVYMSDYFYETCDELGILIWQDMMFACNNYPTIPTFLQSVRTEISQNVRRIQHHACIAVWAGNNEMEAATKQHWYIDSSNEDLFFKEYAQLYVDTLKPIVYQYDPTRPYLTSSPTNGVESEKAKYHLADNPYSGLYGDTHNYDYNNNLWDPATAPNSRFCSEFGIQSLPQLSTFKKVATADDLKHWVTKYFESRQHLGGGNDILQASVKHQFDIENVTLEYFIYLSQIYQAGGIKTITEKMRRDKGILRPDGTGHNMGALYWQLNDVWQAPTWSSIDYDGNWKILHYFARKFFSPILLSPSLNSTSDTIDVTFISDLRYQLHNVTVLTEAFTWDSTGSPNKTFITHLTLVESNSAHKIFSKPLSEFFAKAEKAQYYIKVSATVERPRVNIEPNYLFLAPLKESINFTKNAEVQIKEVEMRKISKDENEFTITLTSKHVSLFTWLIIPGVSGKFSDNGFIMLGDKKVTFINENISVKDILQKISVMNVQKSPELKKPLQLLKSSANMPSTQWPIYIAVFIVQYFLRQK